MSQESSASAHFFFSFCFFFGHTQDVAHDQSQVSQKDKEHKTGVVLQLAADDHPKLKERGLAKGQSKIKTHKHCPNP